MLNEKIYWSLPPQEERAFFLQIDGGDPQKNHFCKPCFDMGAPKPCMKALGRPENLAWAGIPQAEIVKLDRPNTEPVPCEECEPNWVC